MVLLTYNTTTSVTLPIRDWGTSTDSSYTLFVNLVNEATGEVEINATTSATLDTDRRTITFNINALPLPTESFFLLTLYDTNASGKQLAVAKCYTLPNGAGATYEPKLTATIAEVDETIVIYGQ